MENIDQLKQDNAKLTERLNNAAKFFREQKVQIESLTKENEELKNKIETLEYTSEDDAKNLGKLNECIKELEKEKIDLSAQLEQRTQQVKETINENKQLLTDNTTLKENNVKLETTLGEFKAEYDFLQGQLIKVTNEFNQLRESTIKSKEENNKIIEDYKNLIDEKTKLAKDCEDKYNKVIQEREMNEKNLHNTIAELNNLYNNCENEKLAIENDYVQLLDKYKELDSKKIDEEKYCIYEKESINNLIDNIINTLNIS